MSLNHLSNTNVPAQYLNPYVGSIKLFNTTNNYNATQLNYFEEYNDEQIQMKDEFGGAINTLFHLNIQRIGNFIHLMCHSPNVFNVINTCTYIENSLNGIIPDRFRPNEIYYLTGLCDNGDATQHIGRIEINTNGNLKIYLDYEKNKKWNNTKNNQFFGFIAIFKKN